MDLISGRWAVYSETLPRSGSMRNGELFELPTWERATGEQGYSYLPTPRASDGPNGGPNMRGSKGDKPLPAAVMDLLPTPRTTDMNGPGHHGEGGMDLRTTVVKLLPTPIVGDSRGSRNATANRTEPGKASNGWTLSDVVFDGQLAPSAQRFGSYSSAIRHHECAFGRVAPEPTAPTGRSGAHRLSSRFVEWMMMLPDQWVTGCGLSRSAELRILGNGVVPAQATAALTEMRTVFESRAARAA